MLGIRSAVAPSVICVGCSGAEEPAGVLGSFGFTGAADAPDENPDSSTQDSFGFGTRDGADNQDSGSSFGFGSR